FSLVRRVLADTGTDLCQPFAELGGEQIGHALLTPTKIYVKPMLALFDKVRVKSVAHITGGGFYENIPRALPKGLGAVIPRENVRVLPIFNLIARLGGISEREMFNVYNMGVGMVAVVSAGDAEKAIETLRANGEEAYLLGSVQESETRVSIVC
ncbi:MAG: AIR synthase-related protein, partial [bacterium]